MKKSFFTIPVIVALTACGGDSLPDHYTGETADAEITSDNATDIVAEVVGGTSYSDVFQNVFGKPRSKALNRGIRTARGIFDEDTGFEAGDNEGDCGGTVSVSATQTSGTVTFKDYCETSGDEEVTTNGSMKFSGSVSQTGPTTLNYTMDLEMTNGDDVSKIAGTMDMSIDQEFNATITMDLSGSDSQSGDSFKFEDYKMVLEGFTYKSISGKVCTSDLGGCVTMKTTTDFASETLGSYSAGTLEITSGSSVIEISVNDSGTCDLSLNDEVLETEDCTNYL